jgi:hypothetical protein
MSNLTTPKPFCFVLMPFSESFSDIYELGIKEACNDAGAYCERVDEQIFQERILDRIYNQIAKADIIIADMTGKNPNVFYEVGYAHALGKNTILLTQHSEDIPFDFKHFPHIIYNNKIKQLKEELNKRIEWFIQNPSIKAEEKLGMEIYIEEKNLSQEEVKVIGASVEGSPTYVKLVFHNNSTTTYHTNDFQVGIVSSNSINAIYDNAFMLNSIDIPNRKRLTMLNNFDIMFPSSYAEFNGRFYSKLSKREELIIVRLFSSAGTRDYSFKILFENEDLPF